MKKDDCIFCKIANGEIPSNTIYEDDLFRVILDNGPATKGHALVLPKDHSADIFEMPEDTLAKAMVVAKKVAGKLKETLSCDGLNIVQNNGECAGQTVHHFHIHLIPRYADDGQLIGWKPGSPSSEELEKVRKTINGES
ncbi:MAG: HIT family protein [Lachnospiraceae bacterium]|nr:HIT family protein [Lachnospiraceae bacterium]